MAVTYPLTVPNVGVRSSTFRLQRVVAESRSVFSGARQVSNLYGSWWEGEIKFRSMTYAEAAQVKAWLASLRGKYGTFYYGDPDNLARGNNGLANTTGVTVDGSGQTGTTLNITGVTPSLTGAFRAGDYIRLKTGESSQLYMVVADADSDGSGDVTLEIEPQLRSATTDGETVYLTDRLGVFALSENMAEWSSDQSCVTEITVAFVEALG